jgi:hypothetical protein
MIKRALWQGIVAGTAGGVVMTLGEKIEQSITTRPSSHVPAHGAFSNLTLSWSDEG